MIKLFLVQNTNGEEVKRELALKDNVFNPIDYKNYKTIQKIKLDFEVGEGEYYYVRYDKTAYEDNNGYSFIYYCCGEPYYLFWEQGWIPDEILYTKYGTDYVEMDEIPFFIQFYEDEDCTKLVKEYDLSIPVKKYLFKTNPPKIYTRIEL